MDTTLDLAGELHTLADKLHTTATPEQLAALVVQLRAVTADATRTYLNAVAAATPMLDRLRELAPLRDVAAKAREAAAVAVEEAQGHLGVTIADERKILDERIGLVCALSHLDPPVPITQIAAAAGLTRARVYRIIAEGGSHPATCACKESA